MNIIKRGMIPEMGCATTRPWASCRRTRPKIFGDNSPSDTLFLWVKILFYSKIVVVHKFSDLPLAGRGQITKLCSLTP